MDTLDFHPDEVELFSTKNSTVSGDVNRAIDAAFTQDAPRKYIGASSLGYVCSRRLQYQYLEILPDAPLSGTQHRTLKIGHVLEDVIANWIKNAGFELETVDPAAGKPFEFTQANGKIQGHVDGIIRKGPLNAKYPILWECKTMNAVMWRDFVKNKLEVSHKHYYVQVQLYMAYLQLDSCLLTALNKDTGELHHELIPFESDVASYYSDRAVQILNATESNSMLPRIATKQDYFECKICRFYKTCWRD
jgi:hypothetical protein